MPQERKIAARPLPWRARPAAGAGWTRRVAGLLALGLSAATGAQPVTPPPDEDGYGIVREAPVHLEEGFLEHLAKARPGERFELPRFNGDTVVAATRRVEIHDEGFDWVGKVVPPDPRFSNALQTYDGAPLGIPVGVFFGAADNAAVINLTAPTVASFRHAHVR